MKTRPALPRERPRLTGLGQPAVLVIALPALGRCGTEEGGSPTGGREVFAQAGCGGCHNLADAGARGAVGPNLDRLEVSVREVERQVRLGGEGMPAYAGQLTDAQIRAIAGYVAQARRGGASSRSSTGASR